MFGAAIALLALVSLGPLQQQQEPVRVWATVTPSYIEVGETATLELHLETRGEKPDLISMPDIPHGLEVLRTSEYTQLRFSLPGGRRQLYRREIVLRAVDPGAFNIPPIVAVVDGARYKTQQITLTVGHAGAARSPGSGPTVPPAVSGTGPGPAFSGGLVARGPRDEVVLHLRIDPDTAYVGQQITLFSQAWVSEDAQIRLRRAPEYHPPNAPGFWTHDLPNLTRSGKRILGDRSYRVQEFQRAYFPLAPGEYTLPPARLTYEVRRSFLYSSDDQDLATDSLRLVVLPFPEEGRPEGFDGAVGRFEITARLEPASVPAGEAAALVVEIEGKGNIRALPPPRIPALPGVELHPPAEDATIRETHDGISGVKKFTWILVPREAGQLRIPPVEYPHFDPVARRYETATAQPLTLEVRSGSADDRSDAPTPSTLRGLRVDPAPPPALRWVRSPLFAVVLTAPLLALIPLVLRKGRRRLRTAPAKPAPQVSPKKRREILQALRRDAAHSDRDLFRALDDLVREEVGAIIGAPGPARGSVGALAEALLETGIPTATVNSVAQILNRIEAARFQPLPPGPEARLELIDETERVLDLLAAQIDARARGRRRGAPKATGATLGAFILLATPQLDNDFARAVELYRTEEFTAAATAFAEYLREHPQDHNAWYNLGNAEFNAGNRGPAIHAWLRALTLSPRDPDARSNLRLAGAHPDLVRAATGRLPLTDDEVILLAGFAALLGAAGFFGYTITGRRPLARIGAGATTLALITIAYTLAPRASNPYAVVLPPELPVRIAPERRAETLYLIDGGSLIRVHERRGDWLRVSISDGEGWVEEHLVGEL